MRGKSLALLVLALGCGLVASIGITQVMAKRDIKPEAPTGETQTIFVAMQEIGMGDVLDSQVLRLEKWPKDLIHEGALTRIEDVEGRRTKTKLYPGEPILESKLMSKGANPNGVLMTIPKGYRVIPVRVDKVSGGPGLILPGDRVDVAVYVTRCASKGIPETGIFTVLQDIKVFAVNDVTDLEEEGSEERKISAQTISLLVTPPQAHKVMLATELGKIRLVMRSPDDDEQVTEVAFGPEGLFRQGEVDGAQREDEDPAETALATADGQEAGFLGMLMKRAKAASQEPSLPLDRQDEAERRTHQMRVIQGGEVEIITLEIEPDRENTASAFWKQSNSSSPELYPAPDEEPAKLNGPADPENQPLEEEAEEEGENPEED